MNPVLFKAMVNLQIADAMVYEGNEQLQKLLCSTSKNIEWKKIQSAQSKIDIGLERKRKCDDDFARCSEKKKSQKNSPPPIPYANHCPHSPT